MILIRLDYADALPAVMQFAGPDDDDAIIATIRKHPNWPVSWQRITEAEAEAIRAARPKPQSSVKDPSIVVGIAEAEKQAVHNYVAAIVEQNTKDHSEELNALRQEIAALNIVIDAIRDKAAEQSDEAAL